MYTLPIAAWTVQANHLPTNIYMILLIYWARPVTCIYYNTLVLGGERGESLLLKRALNLKYRACIRSRWRMIAKAKSLATHAFKKIQRPRGGLLQWAEQESFARALVANPWLWPNTPLQLIRSRWSESYTTPAKLRRQSLQLQIWVSNQPPFQSNQLSDPQPRIISCQVSQLQHNHTTCLSPTTSRRVTVRGLRVPVSMYGGDQLSTRVYLYCKEASQTLQYSLFLEEKDNNLSYPARACSSSFLVIEGGVGSVCVCGVCGK